MRLWTYPVVVLWVGVSTASCGGDTLTPNERAAAECAEIVDGDWAGELDGDTLSARLSYVGGFGCVQGGDGGFNSVDVDWSWRGVGGDNHLSYGVFIYRPDSPDPDSLSVRLSPSEGAGCLLPFLENGLEMSFVEPNRMRGTVTLWLDEPDSTGFCPDPPRDRPLVDLRDVPIELIRAADG